ncbi:MAG TPA: hypothetical protein ENK02_15925 [Planctomycetes bacterium]|nr:hypothetical protein [Planctomycetota bacterium]
MDPERRAGGLGWLWGWRELGLALGLGLLLALLSWPGLFLEGESIYSTSAALAHEPWKSALPEGASQTPNNPEVGDLDLYFFPQLAAALRRMHEDGEFPLWNPQLYGGASAIGNPQVPVASPFTWALLLFQRRGEPFDPARLSLGLSWMGILRYLFCFVFGFLWLRLLGGGRWTALAGAAFLSLGPYNALWRFSTPEQVASLWPMVLFFAEAWLRNKRGSWLGLAALSLGLSNLGGYPQTSLLFFLFLMGYMALRGEGRRGALAGLFVVGVSTLLAMPVWGPFAEYLDHSRVRELRAAEPWLPKGGSLGLGVFLILALGLALRLVWSKARERPRAYLWMGLLLGGILAAATLGGADGQALFWFFPDIAGHPCFGGFHAGAGLGPYLEVNQDSLGLAFFLLVLAFPGGSLRQGRTLLGLLLLAASSFPILFQALRLAVPMVAPSRLASLVPLVAAMLLLRSVAEGKRLRVGERRRCFGRSWLLLLGVLLVLLVHGREMLHPRWTVGIGLVAGLLLPLAPIRLWAPLAVLPSLVPGLGFHPAQPLAACYPRVSLIERMQREEGRLCVLPFDALPGNTPLVYGEAQLFGYDGLEPKRFFELAQYLPKQGPGLPREDWKAEDLRLGDPLFDIFGAGLVVARKGAKLPKHFEVLERGSLLLARNPRALPEFQYLGKAYDLTRDPYALARRNPREAVALERPPRGKARDGGGSVRVLRRWGNGVELELRGTGGWLSVRRGFDPGWRVELDGEPVGFETAYHIWMAVRVPAGTHSLRLRYLPASFVFGLWAAGFGLLLCLLSGFLFRRGVGPGQ